MAEVCFVAPGLHHASAWVKEWGFSMAEVYLACNESRLIWVKQNFLPTQCDLYVCQGLSVLMWERIEIMRDKGFSVTDAEADFIGGEDWGRPNKNSVIFPKSTSEQFKTDPLFLLDIEP